MFPIGVLGVLSERYSCLRAVTGSTRRARTAGVTVANTATLARIATTAANVAGSDGRRPGTRNIATGRVTSNASASPIVRPTPVRLKLLRQIVRNTCDGAAPSA